MAVVKLGVILAVAAVIGVVRAQTAHLPTTVLLPHDVEKCLPDVKAMCDDYLGSGEAFQEEEDVAMSYYESVCITSLMDCLKEHGVEKGCTQQLGECVQEVRKNYNMEDGGN